MKTLLNPWFIAGCVIWAIVIPARKLGHPMPSLINGYLDDTFRPEALRNHKIQVKGYLIRQVRTCQRYLD